MSDAALPRLGIVVASTRPGRVGAAVGEWFTKVALDHGAFDVRVLDLASVDLPLLDEPNHPVQKKYTKDHTHAWSREVDGCDAFTFVTPEYNYAMAPALLNAVDYLFHEWSYKPAGFVSYGGVSGGTRSVQMAKQVVTSVKMMPMAEGVFIPFVRKFIGEDGRFQQDEMLAKSALAMLDEIARWEGALRSLRPASKATAPAPTLTAR